MRLSTKIASVAAATAVALTGSVAIVGSAQAAPAKVTTTITGKTIVDFKKSIDKAMAAAGITITATKPAAVAKLIASYPITTQVGDTFNHAGTITMTGKPGVPVTITNPVVSFNFAKKTGFITATTPIGNVELFTMKHLKITPSDPKVVVQNGKKMVTVTTRYQSTMNLTTNAQVCETLSQALGMVFTPGMGLGQTRTTVATVKTKPVA